MSQVPGFSPTFLAGTVLVSALVCLLAVALATGPGGWPALVQAVHGEPFARVQVCDLRLPRALVAMLVGAALASAGVVFQGLLANPLAGPYTLGLSSGAALGASLALVCGLAGLALPLAAFAGAGLTLALVLALARGGQGLEPRLLILAGIVVGSVLAAGVSLVKVLAGDSLAAVVFWVMGSLSGRGWAEVHLAWPWIVIGLAGLVVYARDLDPLALGAEHAHACGVEVAASRRALLLLAALVSAAAVAVSGVIGFVGLIVPHLLRLLLGPGHRRLLLLAIPGGAILLLAADLLGRAGARAAGEGEIPVGVVTALLGGPFFCLLLMRRRGTDGAG